MATRNAIDGAGTRTRAADQAAETPSGQRNRGWTADHAISPWPFFALTYLLSWGLWAPLVLSHFHVGPFAIPEGSIALLRLFGVLMPAAASLVFVARSGGRRLVGAMLSRLRLWDVPWTWWVAAAFAQPAILIACAAVYGLLGGEPPLEAVGFASTAEFVVTLIFLGIAVLGEEIGWRGLALPALQARMSPIRASVVLGILWGLWHLPFWLLLETYTQFGVGYLVLNLLLVVPTTVFITWFFNHTRGSLLLMAAYHLVFNIVNTGWLPVTSYVAPFLAFIALQWVLALTVVRHLGVAPNVAPVGGLSGDRANRRRDRQARRASPVARSPGDP